MNDILETIIKQETKNKSDKKLKCPECGNEMIDNTFMHGSRLAGNAECLKCKTRLKF